MMKIIMSLFYSIGTLFYVLIEITLALEVKEAVKFSGYAPENINGNPKSCFLYPLN